MILKDKKVPSLAPPSKKPEAKAFKKRVTYEVLPSIREDEEALS